MFPPEKELEAECILTARNWIGRVRRRITSHIGYHGIKCTIILEPFESLIPTAYIPGDDCKRDCLELMRDVGQGLTKPQMQELFESRGIIHATRTLEAALSDLVKAGELVAPGRGNRTGYHFPGSK